MGSNLNQVFISNALTMLDGSQAEFGSLAGAAAADDVGVFTLAPGTAEYKQTAIYDAVIESGGAADAGDTLALASPLWLFSSFQLVQRALTGNVIASPIISTAGVKRIAYTNHTAWVGHKATIANATLDTTNSVNNDEYQFKFIIRTIPVNQTAFYNTTAAGIYTKQFPAGAFNATNHKAININAVMADHADADNATNLSNLQAAIANHGLLKDMISAADVGANMVVTSLHPGFTFDLIVTNADRDDDGVIAANTAEVKGSGNDWQVADDEARTRYGQSNFNRMYFPQAVDTYVTAGSAYDKIVVEYDTPNWPNGAGIAPAGGRNIATIYYTSEGTDPSTTSSEFATVFGYTNGTDKEFVW